MGKEQGLAYSELGSELRVFKLKVRIGVRNRDQRSSVDKRSESEKIERRQSKLKWN